MNTETVWEKKFYCVELALKEREVQFIDLGK